MRSRNFVKYIFLAFVSLFLFSCTKEEVNPIPECQVNLKTPYVDYVSLKSPGSYKEYLPDGSLFAMNTKLGFGGVLVFRDLENKLRACDLACPVEAHRDVCVEVKMPYATCPVCKTVYDLSYGFCVPIEGESKFSLKIYSHVTDKGNYILVTN